MNEKCKAKVKVAGCRMLKQCSHNAVKDGFCSIHHPDAEKARQAKSDEAYMRKCANSPWKLLSNAKEEIATLKARIAVLEKELAEAKEDLQSEFEYQAGASL